MRIESFVLFYVFATSQVFWFRFDFCSTENVADDDMPHQRVRQRQANQRELYVSASLDECYAKHDIGR